MIKADMRCSSVAAASVLAKVERDDRMVELAREHPHYCWEDNKGYSASAHMHALGVHGPSEQHRRSWSLPGVAPVAPQVVGDDEDVAGVGPELLATTTSEGRSR